MRKHKSFKTVSGYLRNAADHILFKLPASDGNAEEHRRRLVAAAQTGQRNAINGLLPQVGITGRIGDAETPRDGVDRLLATDGMTAQQTDALKTCDRWLKNFIIPISATLVSVKSGDRPSTRTYLVHGFSRGDHKVRVSMLVDFDEREYGKTSPHDIAEAAAPQFCFHASMNVDVVVPDDCKLRLFTSEAELHDAVPALKPRRRA